MSTSDLSLIAHLMRRAGFGATRDELEAYAAKGYDALVEDLLHPERFPQVADDDLRRYYLELNDADSMVPFNARWIYRMVNTRRPLEEKMALFWHHLFATSVGKSEHGPSSIAQLDTFRRNGLSDLRIILMDLARDPAMIHFLDNSENHKDEPNENWGRELLELFSMGVGNYTERDIKMVARAFTGWTFTQPIPLDPYGRYGRGVYPPCRRPRRRCKDVPGADGAVRRRGHHRHHREAARHGAIHRAAPLQLLCGRRAPGTGVERDAAS